MRKNKIKQMMLGGKPVINGWCAIPSTVSCEAMTQQGWDSLTIDMQHGLIDYSNALPMLQTISATNLTPLARVNWNEPGQIMKILDAGCYGVICPMVSNKQDAEQFVQACMYPPKGYRSFGPVRGLMYGGADYPDHANDEILKIAMIETKESLDKLDEIMSTPGIDAIYIGPADLSLALKEKPGFDRPENSKAYSEILRILEHAKKNNIFAGIHNGTPEYSLKMIEKGFNFVTIASDLRFLSSEAKKNVDKIKGIEIKKERSSTY
jgi:4-hydroxy-2-oxoheptanedioate aldolase